LLYVNLRPGRAAGHRHVAQEHLGPGGALAARAGLGGRPVGAPRGWLAAL
jgi:hypothetical protein